MGDVGKRDGGEAASVDEVFAENLKRRRKQAGMTQAELGRRMAEEGFDYHQTTIVKIESGSRAVRIAEAVALAGILGAAITDLLWPIPEDAKAQEEIDVTIRRLTRAHARAEHLRNRLTALKAEKATQEIVVAQYGEQLKDLRKIHTRVEMDFDSAQIRAGVLDMKIEETISELTHAEAQLQEISATAGNEISRLRNTLEKAIEQSEEIPDGEG